MEENSQNIQLTITEDDQNNFKRLDHFLTKKLSGYSRTFLKSLFQNGHIYLAPNTSPDQNKLELKKMPAAGSQIIINIPPPIPIEAVPENIPLEILYEDEHLLIINKHPGIVTHPAPGNYSGTIVNAILHHCTDLTGIGSKIRPGIVHRLDKGTSGTMVIAKSQKCHEGLILLFSHHDIDRIYEAISMGRDLAVAGTINAPIGRHPSHRLKMATNVRNSKIAKTHYKVLSRFKKSCHLELKLETGRTHQIRVHLSNILKSPILCDPLYGNPKEHLTRLPALKNTLNDYEFPLLHARRLGFIHPITKKKLVFEVNPPDIFARSLDILKGECEST